MLSIPQLIFSTNSEGVTIKFSEISCTYSSKSSAQYNYQVCSCEIPSYTSTNEGVGQREMLLFSANVHLHGGESRQIDQSIL